MNGSGKLLLMVIAGILIATGIIAAVSALQQTNVVPPPVSGTVTSRTTLFSTQTSIRTSTATSTAVSISVTTKASNSTPPTGVLSAQVTDPVNLPPGSSHLYLTFSDVEVHTLGVGNASIWVGVARTHQLDAFSLANKSVTIGSSLVNSGHYDQVRFTLQSAQITYQGKNYSVLVQNSQSIIEIPQGGIQLGANSSAGFIVDLSSVVLPWQTGYVTNFEMFSSVSCVPVPPSSWSKALEQVGSSIWLSAQSWWTNPPTLSSSSIKILTAILSTNTLLVVVQNNATSDITLSAISVIGVNTSDNGSHQYEPVASFAVLSNGNVLEAGQQLGQFSPGATISAGKTAVLLYVGNITTLLSPVPPYSPYSIVAGQNYIIQLVNPYGATLDIQVTASPTSSQH